MFSRSLPSGHVNRDMWLLRNQHTESYGLVKDDRSSSFRVTQTTRRRLPDSQEDAGTPEPSATTRFRFNAF